MKLIQRILVTVSLTFILAFNINTQVEIDTSEIWRIVTIDGNEYYGQIINETDDIIEFNSTLLGLINIPKKQIKVQRMLNDTRVENGEVWLENLQATRYFWAPNGYGLKKGEGYYQNVWVLFNQASIGITKNISIGAGTIPLFLFDGAPTPVFAVPKISFPLIKEKLNMGGGVIIGTILSNDEWFETDGPFGIAYGVATYGNKDNNLNLGVGWAFAEGESAERPVFSLGGMARINKRSYFVTENYLYPAEEWFGLIAMGGRTVWQRVSLDYGLVFPIASELDGFIAIPWLSFSVPFQY